MRSVSVAPVLALLSLAGCGDTSTPPGARAATVDVTPASAVLRLVGDTERLTATVRDGAGTAIEGAPVTWTSSRQEVATVSTTGTVVAQGPGDAIVTARSGSATGTASVEIPPVPAVSDLRTLDVSESWVDLRFTQVADGLGGVASYQVRYREDALPDFDAGTPAEAGSCAGTLPGTGVGDVATCRLEGLSGGRTYAVRVAAFRGTLGTTAVRGAPSPAAAAVTACPARVRLDREALTIVGVGASDSLRAVTVDCRDRPVSGASPTWRTSHEGVVVVEAGRVEAVGIGSAWVTALDDCCAPDSIQVVVSPPPGAVWPNEPISFREISSNPFDEPFVSGGCDTFGWCYIQRDAPSEHRRVTDPTAPQGDSSVLEVFYATGLRDGLDPGAHWIAVDDRELFVGFTFKLDPVFQTPENGQKLGPFLFESQGDTDFFQLLKNLGDGRLVVGWNFVGGRVRGVGGQLLLPDEPGTVTVEPGRWYRVEAYVKRQTAAPDDGVVRWWMSQWTGTSWTEPLLQGSYAGLAFNGPLDARWVEFQLNGTWGGGNSDKRQDDWVRIDRVHVSHR